MISRVDNAQRIGPVRLDSLNAGPKNPFSTSPSVASTCQFLLILEDCVLHHLILPEWMEESYDTVPI